MEDLRIDNEQALEEVIFDRLNGEACNIDDDFPQKPESETFLEQNIIKIDTEYLSKSKINIQKFTEGVEAVSYLCGAITALVNVGITPNKAMDYIVDKEATEVAMKHNIDMSNIQKDISIETAKLNFVNKVDNF